MNVITRSTQVMHPDDRLARWYSQRHAYLNASEIAGQYSPDSQHLQAEFGAKRPRDHRKILPKLQALLQLFGWVMALGLTVGMAMIH